MLGVNLNYNVENLLKEPIFEKGDLAKKALCQKLKENDSSLVDSIKSLGGVSSAEGLVKEHVIAVMIVVCAQVVETKGLKILKKTCANLLYYA